MRRDDQKKKKVKREHMRINQQKSKQSTHTFMQKKNKKHFGTINRYVYVWQMYIRFYTVSIQCQNDIMSLEYHFAASVTFFFYKLKWLWGIKTGIITIKKNSRFKHKRKKQGLGESKVFNSRTNDSWIVPWKQRACRSRKDGGLCTTPRFMEHCQ